MFPLNLPFSTSSDCYFADFRKVGHYLVGISELKKALNTGVATKISKLQDGTDNNSKQGYSAIIRQKNLGTTQYLSLSNVYAVAMLLL